MSKEYLEALERLYCSGNLQLNYVLSDKHKQDYETVEQALQRLESIDNAKPSEALEDFKIIKFKTINAGYNYGYEVWDKIERALIKAQEQEKENAELKKILSIIKEKRIDIESFYITFIEDEFDYNHYEKYYGTYGLECLTQEEFELLKRWLG